MSKNVANAVRESAKIMEAYSRQLRHDADKIESTGELDRLGDAMITITNCWSNLDIQKWFYEMNRAKNDI